MLQRAVPRWLSMLQRLREVSAAGSDFAPSAGVDVLPASNPRSLRHSVLPWLQLRSCPEILSPSARCEGAIAHWRLSPQSARLRWARAGLPITFPSLRTVMRLLGRTASPGGSSASRGGPSCPPQYSETRGCADPHGVMPRSGRNVPGVLLTPSLRPPERPHRQNDLHRQW